MCFECLLKYTKKKCSRFQPDYCVKQMDDSANSRQQDFYNEYNCAFVLIFQKCMKRQFEINPLLRMYASFVIILGFKSVNMVNRGKFYMKRKMRISTIIVSSVILNAKVSKYEILKLKKKINTSKCIQNQSYDIFRISVLIIDTRTHP